jgi:hypothetical protein
LRLTTGTLEVTDFCHAAKIAASQTHRQVAMIATKGKKRYLKWRPQVMMARHNQVFISA